MTDAKFHADLARGKAGEQFIAVRHGLELAPDGERRYDLRSFHASGAVSTYEVKTDAHDPHDTHNFFMELRTRVAGVPGELLGGPWRAREHGVDWFVYLYYKPGAPWAPRAYWFDTSELVYFLDVYRDDFETRRVRFGRLTGVGLLVPRAKLRHLGGRHIYHDPGVGR